MKLIVSVVLALGVAGSAWAVRAPQRETTTGCRRIRPASTPTGCFSADGLGLAVSPGAEFIEVSVTPLGGKSSYYLKGSVR